MAVVFVFGFWAKYSRRRLFVAGENVLDGLDS